MKLIHGDYLKIMREMADNSVDVIVTDPPYGILKHRIEQPIDITAFFQESLRILKPNSFIVYFGRQPTLTDWNSIAFKYFRYKQEIIWYKRQRASPLHDMGQMFENIIVATKGNKKFNEIYRPYCDVKESLAEFEHWKNLDKLFSVVRCLFKEKATFDEAKEFLIASKDELASRFYRYTTPSNDSSSMRSDMACLHTNLSHLHKIMYGIKPQNLISFTPHNKQSRDMSGEGKGDHNIKHPTVKPIQLMEYLIDLVSRKNQVVLDPFMGSGTTGLACWNTGRDFIGVEIFEEYFEIAQQRILHAQQQKSEQHQIGLSL